VWPTPYDPVEEDGEYTRTLVHDVRRNEGLTRLPPSFSLPVFLVTLHCHLSLLCYSAYRETTADVRQAFRGKEWPYRCIQCDRLLLKPTLGMATWQDWARAQPPGSLPAIAAFLPVFRFHLGVERAAKGAATLPLCLSVPRHFQRQTASRLQCSSEPPAPSVLPFTVRRELRSRPEMPAPLATRRTAVLQPRPTPPPALGGATAPAGPGSRPHGSSPSSAPMFHRVVGADFEHSFASAMASRQAGEREAAAQLQILMERGRAATPAPLCADAELRQHPVDPHGRLPTAGGDTTPPSSTPGTEFRAVPSCQRFLDGLMEGKYDGDKDN